MSKYKFDRDQLEFDEVRRGLFGRVSVALKYIVGSILLAVLYYVIFALIFNTGEEESLLNENEMLQAEYNRSFERFGLLDSVVAELSERDRNIYMSIFKTNPPDFGGDYRSGLYYQLDTSSDRTIVKSSAAKLSSLKGSITTTRVRSEDIYNSIRARRDSISMIPSILPMRDMSVSQTGAGFGRKMHPYYKTMTNHQGIDLLATVGTEVVSTIDGTVKEVVSSDRGRGNQVVITSGKGYTIHYAHLGTILVRKGQIVNRGMVIARVGNSGLSFAPHLHYEVHLNDKPVDPVNYFFAELSPRDYMEMVTVALNSGQSLD